MQAQEELVCAGLLRRSGVGRERSGEEAKTERLRNGRPKRTCSTLPVRRGKNLFQVCCRQLKVLQVCLCVQLRIDQAAKRVSNGWQTVQFFFFAMKVWTIEERVATLSSTTTGASSPQWTRTHIHKLESHCIHSTGKWEVKHTDPRAGILRLAPFHIIWHCSIHNFGYFHFGFHYYFAIPRSAVGIFAWVGQLPRGKSA